MSSSSSEDEFQEGTSSFHVDPIPFPFYCDSDLSALEGLASRFDNITDMTLPPAPIHKPKSKAQQQGQVNGTETEEKAEPEQPIDTSKLEIKFVDQTWDLKRVSNATGFPSLLPLHDTPVHFQVLRRHDQHSLVLCIR